MKFMWHSFFLFFLLFQSSQLLSQSSAALNEILNKITTTTKAVAAEKLYLHTDKPSYFPGDTLWFKAYLLNVASLEASEKSNLGYIEIINSQDTIVRRELIWLQMGVGWGCIPLSTKSFPEGDYTLRAYTSWMRNGNENQFFYKSFTISDIKNTDWLVHLQTKMGKTEDNDYLETSLRFTTADEMPIPPTDMQVKVTDRKHVLTKGKLQTDATGFGHFRFPLQTKQPLTSLQATVVPAGNTKNYIIPLTTGLQSGVDLQFMPEGGYLLEGMENLLAFKAIGPNGLALTVSGVIKNSRNETVATLLTSFLGMGSFLFRPEQGETYRAIIHFMDGDKDYPLPEVKTAGLQLRVINEYSQDSIRIFIAGTPDLIGQTFYMVGQAAGAGYFGTLINPHPAGQWLSISKNIFPSGVATISLLNTARDPICERSIFIARNEKLQVKIEMQKVAYHKLDSTAITITVKDPTGRPVQGSFSLAVTDDNQVLQDTMAYRSLIAEMLLAPYLKGYIESPGYYFQQPITSQIWKNLDNLLLAQGWVGYNWNSVFSQAPLQPIFAAEQSYSIKGRIKNFFGKPLANSNVVLFGKRPSLLIDTTTNDAGMYYFDNLQPQDTALYFIQARNKNGKNFGVEVVPEEFISPEVQPASYSFNPWYINTDTPALKVRQNRLNYVVEQQRISEASILKDVIVTAKRGIPGSHNLNGAGNYDFALTMEDLDVTGRKSLNDILFTYIPNFFVSGYWRPDPLNHRGPAILTNYLISGKLIHFIIDGVDIASDDPTLNELPREQTSRYNNIKSTLDYISEEDIKGIEVIKNPKYISRYLSKYIENPLLTNYVFIEITTYSGNGAYLKHQAGTVLIKPLHYVTGAQFYSPAYPTTPNSNVSDIRSTIYWNPNIVTNEQGRATVSFYTASKPGKYTLLLEGTDLHGLLASERGKLKVE